MSDQFAVKDADEIIQKIGSALVNDQWLSSSDWDGVAVVATVERSVRSVSGYTFDEMGKAKPGIPRNKAIKDFFAELQAATAVDGKTPWKAALLQIKRDGMSVKCQFEYDSPQRWELMPDSNLEETMASLRP